MRWEGEGVWNLLLLPGPFIGTTAMGRHKYY